MHKIRGEFSTPIFLYIWGFAAFSVFSLWQFSLQYDKIKFISILGAPQGLKRFSEIYPDVPVYIAKIDEGLNENGYIIPGLGDAGDRVFNTL